MPYGPRFSDDELRLMARVRIDDGRLPNMLSRMFSPHYGLDELCQLCDQRIDSYRVGYHLTDPRSGEVLSFHMACYKLWQLECCGVGSATSAVVT